ncbi:MAG: hypothetical protein AVDCRST_MAG72-1486, partial [uncultured Nocardioidaceae bacterium]
ARPAALAGLRDAAGHAGPGARPGRLVRAGLVAHRPGSGHRRRSAPGGLVLHARARDRGGSDGAGRRAAHGPRDRPPGHQRHATRCRLRVRHQRDRDLHRRTTPGRPLPAPGPCADPVDPGDLLPRRRRTEPARPGPRRITGDEDARVVAAVDALPGGRLRAVPTAASGGPVSTHPQRRPPGVRPVRCRPAGQEQPRL